MDLVLARACLGCQLPGAVMCAACTARVAHASIVGRLDGRPIAACGPYRGLLRDMVLEYKERGTRAMAPTLGELLAVSVISAHVAVSADSHSPREPITVVPIPGHARPARGFCALDEVVRHARPRLEQHRLAQHRLSVASLMGITHAHSPVKMLARGARATQVHGTMSADASPPGLVILVDDVMTSGATMREGIRAMESGGHRVVALAVLARTDGPNPDRPARRPGSVRATSPQQAGR